MMLISIYSEDYCVEEDKVSEVTILGNTELI